MPGNRQTGITTPLGKDELLFSHMRGQEQLGRMFQYDVVMFSPNPEINIDDILGQNVTIELTLNDGGVRYFNGFVTRFSQLDAVQDDYSVYEATISPWLWFLTRTADCRIFQEKTVPDIVKEVFNDNGFSDFEEKLSGSYRQWEYCVQYRETDFNFISRLLEQEGIYYYFTHKNGLHKLVLADEYSSHAPIPGEASVPYHPPGTSQTLDVEHVSDWNLDREIQPGKYALTDYDFKKPKNNLLVNRIQKRGHAESDREIFDYPGEYVESVHGDQYALERIEELHTGFEQVSGETSARNMAYGCLFTLTDHPRGDQNREYLITDTSYDLSSSEYVSGSASDQPVYACQFSAIESKTVFRADRITPKPVVQGPQTAVVVGPAGEEIYPDKYGRIKVQFHWDRYGKKNENSSCWIRVAQAWAGPGWGAQFIPRIGQEVMVEFLEGDPDRPIITGRVYNADNMPPYGLPDNKTQSGFKSRSSKGASAANFNEIRLEDKKGSEELYIQAEKDENILVKNDKGETVGHDETISIGNDREETVGHDETITVGNDREEKVGHDETFTVGNDRDGSVGRDETLKVGKDRTLSVANDQDITVGSNETVSVGTKMTISVGGDSSLDVGKTYTVKAGLPITIESGAAITLSAAGSMIKIGPEGITIQTGAIVNVMGALVKLN